jgi:hypothetical protein
MELKDSEEQMRVCQLPLNVIRVADLPTHDSDGFLAPTGGDRDRWPTHGARAAALCPSLR